MFSPGQENRDSVPFAEQRTALFTIPKSEPVTGIQNLSGEQRSCAVKNEIRDCCCNSGGRDRRRCLVAVAISCQNRDIDRAKRNLALKYSLTKNWRDRLNR